REAARASIRSFRPIRPWRPRTERNAGAVSGRSYGVASTLERPPDERLPPPGPRTALHVLSQRNFAPYFAGNALSASGTWFQNLAAALLVYRLTHSPFLLGVLNFAQFVPV